MKTTLSAKPATIKRDWYLIDATDLVLGRMASQIATILRGKNKTSYTPHMDCGDYVVVINADKVALTGKKLERKMYYHHSGYIGGIKGISAGKLMEKKPQDVIYKAVERMISRNKLGRQMMTKLRIYAGAEHPHTAQNPIVLDLAAKNPKNKRSDV
ncbi:MAG: 50S ribosomal protein L13 [Alphaproteobacteria bacterium]|nr:50S ribosomal protein L13 [Alphaproteobacteria bacterium]